MTDEEWLAAYLLRFGTATINNANVQDGEAEFLRDMGRRLRSIDGSRGAWSVIRETYERRMYDKGASETRRP